MMEKRIIDQIIEKRIKYLAIIGLAKNAGKTVAFNTIVNEAQDRDLNLALLSYGRDGEEVDAITRQEKPRIFIPPHCIFVTASKAYEKSNLRGELLKKTGLKTLLGEVNIYRNGFQGGYVELVGINSGSQVETIKGHLSDKADLVLIDGALDRRSSAMPSLTDGLILATGAVIGNTEELVVNKTIYEIKKLTLPEINEISLMKHSYNLFSEHKGGLVTGDNKLIKFSSGTSFGSIETIKKYSKSNVEAIILNGALVDSFIEKLIYELEIRDCKLIVKDGTRVFLNRRNFNLMRKNNIYLMVYHSIELVSVTVNPVSPYGVHLESNKLVNMLGKKINVPVCDILSKEYRSRDNVYMKG